ncbi:hypothetical protein SAMN05444413_101428 [Roseivivax marinus]|nr:hypothetical protein SAMN05444413_101428 [Roseivivax marinus]
MALNRLVTAMGLHYGRGVTVIRTWQLPDGAKGLILGKNMS